MPRGPQSRNRLRAKLAAGLGARRARRRRQVLRDPSSIAIGVVFPVILILLFGYGLSLDVTKDVPIAVVDWRTPRSDSDGPHGRRIPPVALSCQVHRRRTSMAEARQRHGSASGRWTVYRADPIRLQPALSRRPRKRRSPTSAATETDANQARHRARLRRRGRSRQWTARRSGRAPRRRGRARSSFSQPSSGSTRPTTAVTSWCPGLIVLVMTIIGAILTADGESPASGSTGHARGPLRHSRCAPARSLLEQDTPLLRAWGMIGLGLCLFGRVNSCSTFPSAARCPCSAGCLGALPRGGAGGVGLLVIHLGV
jgi:ABC-2 type transport system permease protein